MTSGTRTIGPSPTGTLGVNTMGFRKTWSGGNGKYETVASGKRTKWNNYHMERYWKQTAGVAYKGRYKASPSSSWANFNVAMGQTLPPSSSLSFSAADENRLQSKLLDKVKGHSFNLAVSTAEANKTVDLVVGTLRTLGKSAIALRHGDFTTAARHLGVQQLDRKRQRRLKDSDVSSRWLEMQYGWLPLVGDVYESFKAYHALSSPPRRKVFRTSVSKTRKGNGSTATRVYTAFYTQKKVRAITYEMTEKLSAPRQIGLTNPLSVLWELTPFSFVVDWFIPIGSYLDNLSQIPFLQGRFMTSTFEKWDCYDSMFSPDSYWPNPVGHSTKPVVELEENARVRGQVVIIDRVVSSSLSPPTPFSFDASGLRGKRVWNAIALAHLAFGKKVHPSKVTDE